MVNVSGLTPLEFYVVVELPPAEEVTKGGIILPNQTVEADKLAGQEGILVAMSPHAFNYVNDWPDGSKPQLGQKVLFKKYEGTGYESDGRRFKLLSDKSIMAIIGEEEQAHAVAIAV